MAITSSVPHSDLTDVILTDGARLGGEPVFAKTRVPIKAMFDYLEAGDSLDVFLDHFPGVPRESAVAVLELAKAGLLNEAVAP